MSQIRNAVRQNVLRLILHSLQHPSPNLAHFLMGYELRKPVAKTNLQDPGKLGKLVHDSDEQLVAEGACCLTQSFS